MYLSDFFNIHNKAAVAFSGGADSAYLVYAAKTAGADIRAYFVNTAFQPFFELKDAKKLAGTLKIDLSILNADILGRNEITKNTAERCYYCKKLIFETILNAAEKDGFSVLLDGTNASDSEAERPGLRANKEFKALSPLKECGLTKAQIRRLSREVGLFTADKPSYSCLATRIKTCEPITAEKLKNIEIAENFLSALGFTDFRVRLSKNTARLLFPAEQYERALKSKRKIISELEKYFPIVLPEFEVRI